MNFQIQNALGGKVIASRSDLTRLRNVMSLLPNTKFEILPPPASPPPVAEKDEDDLQKEILKVQDEDYQDQLDKLTDSDEDDDDIMHDPDIQEMVKNGEHTCHMFDAHCQACEDDEEEEEDEDDITLADLKEQLEDNMTLAEIQKELVKVEATKKRLETIRLKKENYKNYENYEEKKETFEFVDEMTYHSRTSDHLPNF